MEGESNPVVSVKKQTRKYLEVLISLRRLSKHDDTDYETKNNIMDKNIT